MKTFNHFKWKALTKKAILLSLAGVLTIGCGKSQSSNNNSSGGNNFNSPVLGGNDAGYWQQLKSQHQCTGNSQGRMADLTFRLSQGSASTYRISGALQSGSHNGSVSSTFVGRNYGSNDLIYIQKVAQGSQVAYNVVLSLCTWISQSNSYGSYQANSIENIGPNAGLSNFELYYATLSTPSNAQTGQVLDAWVKFTSQNYGGQIPVRFAPVQTNNQYR